MPNASQISNVLHAEPLVLVDEITHRVLNEYTQAIASIRLAAARSTNIDARTTLVAAAEMLCAFAEAHRALRSPATAGETDLGDYLEQLCGALSLASLRDRGVRLILIQESIILDVERCWRVGLIVAELITNAVRHGFRGGAGVIVIDVGTIDGEVQCRVADNGGSSPNPPPSRGRHVVEGLACELGGTVNWRFGPDGVTALLVFPKFVGREHLRERDLQGHQAYFTSAPR